MPSATPHRLTAVRLTAVLLAAAIGLAAAVPAAAQERCEGTLCDLYYGNSPAAAPAQPATSPAAPKPLMAPTGPGYFRNMLSSDASQQASGQAGTAPAAPSRVQVGGGGLAAMARGEKTERCEGTLCDLYYGGSAPEPEEQAAVAVAPPSTVAAGLADGMDEGTRQRIRFRQAEVAEAAKPRCTSKAGDPWKCYR